MTIVHGSRPGDHSALVKFVIVDETPFIISDGGREDTAVLAAPIEIIEPGAHNGDFFPTLGLVAPLRHGDMIPL